MGVKLELWELINRTISSWVNPSENSCLVDWRKLFFVYLLAATIGPVVFSIIFDFINEKVQDKITELDNKRKVKKLTNGKKEEAH